MKYRLRFIGRKVGAIGITHECTIEVEASSREEAERKAYDTHEHIRGGLAGVVAEELPE